MTPMSPKTPHPHACPWWFIRVFDNPLRRWIQPPDRLVHDLVREGECCLDLGCGIGYFTIPLARRVGPGGTVRAVDLQARMLEGVRRRADRAALSDRIICQQAELGAVRLEGAYDFVLAFWMLHEVADQRSLLRDLQRVLKPGGRFAIVEPRVHVGAAAFGRSIALALESGFERLADLSVPLSRGTLLTRPLLSAA